MAEVFVCERCDRFITFGVNGHHRDCLNDPRNNKGKETMNDKENKIKTYSKAAMAVTFIGLCDATFLYCYGMIERQDRMSSEWLQFGAAVVIISNLIATILLIVGLGIKPDDK